MRVQEMGPVTGNYIVSEANGTRSRDVVTIAAGQKLLPGAVLGKITASGLYTAVAPAATDGSESAVAVLYAAVDATDAEKPGVVTARDAEVAGHALIWPAGTTTQQKADALEQLALIGFVAR